MEGKRFPVLCFLVDERGVSAEALKFALSVLVGAALFALLTNFAGFANNQLAPEVKETGQEMLKGVQNTSRTIEQYP